MKPWVLCIVGPSGSGKTLVASALIRSLSGRGYRIAAVKHSPHGYRLDVPGKDSDRLKSAGAVRVGLVSPSEWAVLEQAAEATTLESMADRLGEGCDLVIAEGFRNSNAPKVLVLRQPVDPTWKQPEGVIAVVCDEPVAEAPWQCGFHELERLAEWLCDRFPRGGSQETSVSLTVDGAPISLSPFVSSIFSRTLWAMVESLKGIPQEASELRVCVRRP